MNATAPALSHRPLREASGLMRQVVSLLAGAAFTLGLFWGIAYHNRTVDDEAPPAIETLETVVIAEPPPPPPKLEAVPEALPMLGFTLARSDSPVKISVSPPNPGKLLPEDLSKAPAAHARTALLTGKFQAKTGFMADPRHVYQNREVDQIPVVRSRGDMVVPPYIRGGARSLSVMLLVIINADGSIGPASLAQTSNNPKFDALMLEKINRWVFSPAIKGGRKVRCMIAQPITFRWTASDSPFHE